MILPDVNVLVYAFDRDAPHHDGYRVWLGRVRSAHEDLALVPSVLTGFVRIVTHPRIMPKPAPTATAVAFVTALIATPNVRWLHDATATWQTFAELCRDDRGIKANLVSDAYIAATAKTHGARVATADRGFARYGVPFFDPVERP